MGRLRMLKLTLSERERTMSVEIRKSPEYQRILRETELGSNKRHVRMRELIYKTQEKMREVWLGKRVKVTSTVRNKEGKCVKQGQVVEVNCGRHIGIMTTLQVKLDEGGYVLCTARHCDLL